MSYKHHQATIDRSYEGQQDVQLFNSYVRVYDTNFSYPSTGIGFNYISTQDQTSSFSAPEEYPTILPTSSDISGTLPNLMLDWNGGGPPGVTSNVWFGRFFGYLWGLTTAEVGNSITFRLTYSGNVRLFFNSTESSIESFNIYDDWEYKAEGSTVTRETVVTTVVNDGVVFPTKGANYFQIDYWNGSTNPHLVVEVLREGIDEDFVVLGCSTVEADVDNLIYGQSITASYTDIYPKDFQISRDHDKITKAGITVEIENASDTFAYNSGTDSFGSIRKGSLIEVYSRYNDQPYNKRFIGNITKAFETSRDEKMSKLTIQSESILAKALDTINFNFPNDACYSYGGFVTNRNRNTEPDGIERPYAFDKWPIKTAIKALMLQSDIDSIYLSGKRKYYDNADTIVDSTDSLIRLDTLSLSSNKHYSMYEVNPNVKALDYIWEYDFGQDTAYDIAKNFLKKYGYYLNQIHAGDLCGYLEVVEISSPTVIKSDVFSSTGMSLNEVRKSAEGYKGHLSTASTSSAMYIDFTGRSVDLIMGIGPDFGDVVVNYSYPIGAAYQSITGYYYNGQYYASNIISTDATTETYYYDGINTSGNNPTEFKLVIPEEYGVIRLQLLGNTSGKEFFFDGIRVFDFDPSESYKTYNTYNDIISLSVSNKIEDIRNDVVVLGASSSGFAFAADEDDLDEVRTKFITSRMVDTRSIYDTSYKYYVGKNKKIIIEDPTIVTQERADWLAIYTLNTLRQSPVSASFEIPTDLGLQLYDGVNIHDVKTESIDGTSLVYISSMVESMSDTQYTIKANASSRVLPFSFQQRQQLTPEELSLYFSNCPVSFESINIPEQPSGGYDPMTSEDGEYISIEWTQLIPGICSVEVWDTWSQRGDGTSYNPRYTGAGTNDFLVAVPYLGTFESRPGTYKVLWDGVHENYEGNDKFNDTDYKVHHKQPAGTGYFARGQNSPASDLLDHGELPEEVSVGSYFSHFPLYFVFKFQPTSDGFSDVTTEYIFGTQNGNSFYNGKLNETNILMKAYHFDLEERLPLVWQFDEDNINYPADAGLFKRHYNDPYRPHDMALHTDSSTFDKEFYENEFEDDDRYIIDSTILNFDSIPPYNYDGTHAAPTYDKVVAMPVIDSTVGVRVFVDQDIGTKKRRFYVEQLDFIYTAVTAIIDKRTHKTNSALGSGNSRVWMASFNITNRYIAPPQSLGSFFRVPQKLTIKDWNYLPEVNDRSAPESVIFSSVLSDDPNSLGTFPQGLLSPSERHIGLGVGNCFAMDPTLFGNFTKDDLANDTVVNASNKVIVIDDFIPYSGGQGTAVFPPLIGKIGPSYDSYMPSHEEYVEDTRKVYNTVLISLDFKFIDRAGRYYFSVAKHNEGNWLIGRHNDIEVKDRYSLDMLPYINRYNPYLPTACYMEREPTTINIDNFKDSDPENTWTTVASKAPDFRGMNLSEVIKNNAPQGHPYDPSVTIFNSTLLDPYTKLFHYTGQLYPYAPGVANLPELRNSELKCGNTQAYFGNGQRTNNRYYEEAFAKRDLITTTQKMPYGLPMYIMAPSTTRYATKLNEEHDVYSVSDETQYYPSPVDTNELFHYGPKRSLLGLTYWSDERYKSNGSLSRYNAVNQRAGIATYYSNMPIFTLISGISKSTTRG